MDRKIIYTQDKAAEVVEVFERLLSEHGIIIPDEDREDGSEDTPIYGMTYGNILYDVEDLLISLINEARENENLDVISRQFSGYGW